MTLADPSPSPSKVIKITFFKPSLSLYFTDEISQMIVNGAMDGKLLVECILKDFLIWLPL